MTLTLVIGGTRSGKSAHAERLARELGGPVRYVATADSADASMSERIARHVARRPPEWETVEAGEDLAATVLGGAVTLLDGLGAWIAGALHRGATAEQIHTTIADLVDASRSRTTFADVVDASPSSTTHVLVVAEEAGQGLLPMDAVSRAWLDALGDAIQQLSAAADHVDYVVAGRPIALHSGRLAGTYAPADAQSQGLRHHGDKDVRPGDADHAVNVLAGGPPAWLKPALAQALDADADRYPDDTAAKRATAARHDRQPDEVVLTNGAVEALWLLAPALRPRHAVCIHPGFTEAEAALKAHGVRTTRVLRNPGSDFALDPAAVPEAADLVIVGNPASPSGTLVPATAIEALRRPGRIVVVDEAFMEMVPGEPGSLAQTSHDDVIVIRSLTKILSVPGVRAGYALAPAPLAAALHAVKPPWSANALALAALTAAVARPDELAALADRATAECADLHARLMQLDGVRVWPSATNFCLIEVSDGPAVVDALRAQRIAVRPAASFPGLGAGHIRVTARDPERNARFVAALAAAVTPSF